MEAAFLTVPECIPVEISDYKQELMLSLSSARELAQQSIRKAQQRCKTQYDKKSMTPDLKIGEWVLVRFPQEETGRNRKLSRPWHGLYRITDRRDPDVSVTKVYFPSEGAIQVYQTRVCKCPLKFPAGYYWYGGKRKGPGRPPKWVDRLLSEDPSPQTKGKRKQSNVPMPCPGDLTEPVSDSAAEEVGVDVSEVEHSSAGLRETFVTEDEPDLEMPDVGGGQVPGEDSEVASEGDLRDKPEGYESEPQDLWGESDEGECPTEELDHLDGQEMLRRDVVESRSGRQLRPRGAIQAPDCYM